MTMLKQESGNETILFMKTQFNYPNNTVHLPAVPAPDPPSHSGKYMREGPGGGHFRATSNRLEFQCCDGVLPQLTTRVIGLLNIPTILQRLKIKWPSNPQLLAPSFVIDH